MNDRDLIRTYWGAGRVISAFSMNDVHLVSSGGGARCGWSSDGIQVFVHNPALDRYDLERGKGTSYLERRMFNFLKLCEACVEGLHPALASPDRYPHTCPACGGPAYVGFTSVDCSNRCGG